jgi:mRNA-degrading endonuclease RelE of RelBE toxin-antitoxin system
MNKNEKLLRRISKEDQHRIEQAVFFIKKGDFARLDIKKISGEENAFRVRVGKFRIKFLKREKWNEIAEICRRGDHTH